MQQNDGLKTTLCALEDEAGQALAATAEMADIAIDNDGTLEELERKLEEVWSNLSRAQ